MNHRIPLYTAEGELADWISEQRLARLEAAGLIARVVRHPKGHINRAILFRRPGEGAAVELRQYMGTRYSFREHLDNGRLCWKLRRLDLRDEDGVPFNNRAVFMRVIRECLVGYVTSRRCWLGGGHCVDEQGGMFAGRHS